MKNKKVDLEKLNNTVFNYFLCLSPSLHWPGTDLVSNRKKCWALQLISSLALTA